MPEEHLCELIRQALSAGRISSRPPDRVWSGPGIGASCPIRHDPVLHGEMKFEVGWARGECPPRVEHFHKPCLAAWVFESLAAGD